jgi:hypothetical protein
MIQKNSYSIVIILLLGLSACVSSPPESQIIFAIFFRKREVGIRLRLDQKKGGSFLHTF